jgi:hypothetical protein
MTKARDIATGGGVDTTNFVTKSNGVIEALDGSALTSLTPANLDNTGTIPSALLAGVGGVKLGGEKTGDGSTGTGSSVNMITSDSINLTDYEGNYLIVYGQTAISENANTANTAILRIQLNNGSSTTTLSASRQGHGAYSDVNQDTNSIVHISAFTVYPIPAAYATNCTIRLNGGVDSGAFTYGNQGANANFDGEGAGIGIKYFVI